MASVAIVSDTTGYLPREMVDANRIRLVSLYVNFGAERTEPEAALMEDLDTLYDKIRSAEQWPTTSQPSVGDFIAAYEPLLENGGSVVSIHISGGVSGTCESARQAAQRLQQDGKGGERVHVFDSQTAAGGLGLMTLVAARYAAAGHDAEAVVARVREARSDLKMWFAIDTLEFLKRSGRVGSASAWIGSTLKIKPILTLESEITAVERVRTSARALERMVDYARSLHESGSDGWVVQHIQSRKEADRLAERCHDIFGCNPVFMSEVGPVLGVHTGPGLLGVGAVRRELIG
jgi:DegV family protein with EDD domain